MTEVQRPGAADGQAVSRDLPKSDGAGGESMLTVIIALVANALLATAEFALEA